MSTESYGWKIRPPKLEEAEALAKVHVLAWQQTYRGQVPDDYLDNLDSDVERRRQIWLQAITKPGDLGLFVAEVENKPVGFATAGPSRETEGVGELLSIYLLREYWGRGIGHRLHDHALDHLRSLGFQEAVLWVLDTNERTRRWYERQGWKADGEEKTDLREGFALNELRYRVRL